MKKLDKGLLYDSSRLGDFNNEFKTNALYSRYIWTNDLHSISKISKPDSRPEFRVIMHELGKYKDKKGEQLGKSEENLPYNKDLIDEQLKERIDALKSFAIDKPELTKRFENLYTEVFESPHALSSESSKKQIQFVSSVMNAKKEINADHNSMVNLLDNPHKKPLVKKNLDTRSAVLLPRSHLRKNKQKLPNVLRKNNPGVKNKGLI